MTAQNIFFPKQNGERQFPSSSAAHHFYFTVWYSQSPQKSSHNNKNNIKNNNNNSRHRSFSSKLFSLPVSVGTTRRNPQEEKQIVPHNRSRFVTTNSKEWPERFFGVCPFCCRNKRLVSDLVDHQFDFSTFGIVRLLLVLLEDGLGVGKVLVLRVRERKSQKEKKELKNDHGIVFGPTCVCFWAGTPKCVVDTVLLTSPPCLAHCCFYWLPVSVLPAGALSNSLYTARVFSQFPNDPIHHRTSLHRPTGDYYFY
jgi:hypothetical protein